MDRDLVKDSKRVSWLLRHGATEQRVPIDPAGWMAVADVLRVLHISEARLDEVVGQNDKKRFEKVGGRIRACQGHSSGAVSLDALEASWTEHVGDAPVFHGTGIDAALAIAEEGIKPQARSHVHLAPSERSKVGKRWSCDVLLEIDPTRLRARGHKLWQSGNGVVLTRFVPAECVVGVRPLVARAHSEVPRLRAAFGLSQAG
ncbi:MAG: RNA 2'-phosphotransferase [Polyangiaceae bacterium]